MSNKVTVRTPPLTCYVNTNSDDAMETEEQKKNQKPVCIAYQEKKNNEPKKTKKTNRQTNKRIDVSTQQKPWRPTAWAPSGFGR